MSKFKRNKKVNEYFERMYKETYPLVFYIIINLVRNENDTLDLVQDTYVSAYQNIDNLKKRDSINFKRWVSVIATNKAKDFLKQKKPMLFTDLEIEDTQPIEIETSREVSPDVIAHQEELFKLVNHVMDSLPENQRICLFLYCFEEKSLTEISEITGFNVNTVKSNIRYARKKIEMYFEEAEKKGFRLYGFAPLALFGFGIQKGFYSFSENLVVPPITEMPNLPRNIPRIKKSKSLKDFSKGITIGSSLLVAGISYPLVVNTLKNTNEPIEVQSLPPPSTVDESLDVFDYITVKFVGDNYHGTPIIEIRDSNDRKIQEILSQITVSIDQADNLENRKYIVLTIEHLDDDKIPKIRTLTKKYLVSGLD